MKVFKVLFLNFKVASERKLSHFVSKCIQKKDLNVSSKSRLLSNV